MTTSLQGEITIIFSLFQEQTKQFYVMEQNELNDGRWALFRLN